MVRKLYVDQVRRFLEPAQQDRSRVNAVGALTVDGRIEPLLAFVEEKLFPAFSQRDYRWVNELAVKTAFLTLLADEPNYMILSEPELERRFADLCLLRRPDARSEELWDVLLEFKYLSLDKLKLRGDELRRLERGDLLRLAGVEDALAAAEEQGGPTAPRSSDATATPCACAASPWRLWVSSGWSLASSRSVPTPRA